MGSGQKQEEYVFKMEPGMLNRILDIGTNPTLPLALLGALGLYVAQPGGYAPDLYLMAGVALVTVSAIVYAFTKLRGQVKHAVITSGMILVQPFASWRRRISPERVKRVVVVGTSTGESVQVQQLATGQLRVDPLMPQTYFVVELTTDDAVLRFAASPNNIDFVVNALQFGGCAFLPPTKTSARSRQSSRPGPA
ncbi:MAG: hypothetical protein HY556_02415 [Euryarchaeota archaeon]|nr:hypothetical protein [Euryarchaeota archaeon]